ARHFDAHGKRGAVAIEHRAALRLDVEPTLSLLLGGLPPLLTVFDLHAVCARHETAEPQAHHAAEQSHAQADPARPARVEVDHGPAVPPDATGPRSRAPRSSIAGRTMMRSALGGSMPSSVRATISTRSGVL